MNDMSKYLERPLDEEMLKQAKSRGKQMFERTALIKQKSSNDGVEPVKSKEPKKISGDGEQENKGQLEFWNENEKKSQGTVKTEVLDHDAYRLLNDIYESEHVTVTQRFENLKIYSNKGKKIIRHLDDRGLVRKVAGVKIGKGRGKSATFYDLLEEGFRVLKRPKNRQGKGGFEHRFYAEKISDYLKNQSDIADAWIEKEVNGKSVDVLMKADNGTLVAYEVTLHKDNLMDNLVKDLQAGCDQVVFVFKIEKSLKAGRKIVEGCGDEELINKAKFELVENYLE